MAIEALLVIFLSMLLRLSNIGKSYGGNKVLRDVSLQVNANEQVGVVGRNGAGKTTIFRLIAGEESPDSGAILKVKNLKVEILNQHADFSASETVHAFALSASQKLNRIQAEMRKLEMLMKSDSSETMLERYSKLQSEFEHRGGFEYAAKAESILFGLGFSNEDWKLKTDQLSGGQQTRLRMSKLLLSEADLLLLDEPTNHLGAKAVEWLEDFLNAYDKSYLIISHDRYFLDKVSSKIIEIENGKAYSYKGNYTKFLAQSELRKQQRRRAFENQQAFISKTEAFIRKNLAGQKTKQAQSRRNMLEKMRRIDRANIVSAKRLSGNFGLGKIEKVRKHLLSVKDLEIGYGEKTLAKDLSFELLREKCVGVIGGNGVGKTTLLKTLLGQPRELSGKIIWGKKATVGYYSQNLDDLDCQNEVISELRTVAPLAEDGELRSFLASFLFFGEDVFKKVSKLSGGEKGRLSLAKLIYSKANVLLLDEPTNHLDVPSREALESSLNKYAGAIITVSHDRYFLDQIATHILSFEPNGKIEIFNGNYSEFHEWKERNVISESNKIEGFKKETHICERTKKHNSLKTASPSKNEVRKIRNRVNEVEKIISQIEEKLKQITFMMNREDVAANHEDFVEL